MKPYAFGVDIGGTADPEVFVINVWLSNAGKILLEKTEFYYRKYAFHAFRHTPPALAELGERRRDLRLRADAFVRRTNHAGL